MLKFRCAFGNARGQIIMRFLERTLDFFQGAFCPDPLGDVDRMTKDKRRSSRLVISNVSTKPEPLTAISGHYAHEAATNGLASNLRQVFNEKMVNSRSQKLSQVSSNEAFRFIPILGSIS